MKRRGDCESVMEPRRDTFANLRENFDRLVQVLKVSQEHQATVTTMISQMSDLAIVVSAQRSRQFEDVRLKLHVLNAFLGNDDFDIEANLAISIADDINFLVPQLLSPKPSAKRKVVWEAAPGSLEHLRTLNCSEERTNAAPQDQPERMDKELTQVT
jgi:hypothetical protein